MSILQNIRREGPATWLRLKLGSRLSPDPGTRWLLLCRCIVGRSRRWLYYQMPKSGSTSIHYAMWRYEHALAPDRVKPAPEPTDPGRILSPERKGAPWVDLKRQHKMDLTGVVRTTSIRNPFTRVVSAYKDQITKDTPRYRMFSKAIGVEQISFQRFLTGLEEGLLTADPHWCPQTHMLKDCPFDFDLYLSVEKLDAELAAFIGALGGANLEPVRVNVGDAKPIELSTSDCARIIRLYQYDFEQFGYSGDLRDRHLPPTAVGPGTG